MVCYMHVRWGPYRTIIRQKVCRANIHLAVNIIYVIYIYKTTVETYLASSRYPCSFHPSNL